MKRFTTNPWVAWLVSLVLVLVILCVMLLRQGALRHP